MKKKKNLLALLLIVILPILAFIIGKYNQKTELYDGSDSVPDVSHKNMLSMMLEQNAGAGDYSLETRSSWPTKEDGYIFNSTLSKCEKGSKLRWDDDNNAVIVQTNVSDKCYVYFDKLPTLADWVKSKYTGVQGENNLYYHTSSLSGGAGDNSYRYAGSSDSVNNFVCFGSSASTCPDDNLYRIIGVFGNQIKLIKWDYANSDLLGTDGDYNSSSTYSTSSSSNYSGSKETIDCYYWNSANSSSTYSATNYYNVWSYSQLNTVNLNTNFLNNIGTTWTNKIAETTWIVGGNSYSEIVSSTHYFEIKNPDTTIESTYNAKVGLVYTSDYRYTASPSAWTAKLSSYSSYINDNWMYMGPKELTITRLSSTNGAFYITASGNIGYFSKVELQPYFVRPVFYLNPDVTYVSGTGTKDSPIRIN